jgi:3-hydroxybutyryl-CoA dehydrogenase
MIASSPRTGSPDPPQPLHVAVLGAGTMGPGIAAAFAAAGHVAALWSRTEARSGNGVVRAREMAALLRDEGLATVAEGADERLVTLDKLDAVEHADLVVEAVAEDLEAKRELLVRVDELLPADRLIATNTSGLRVTDVAAPLPGRARVVAMHFWNPAHLMPLVEVGGGEATAPDAVERALEIARGIGKQPVHLEREILGFLGTRLQQAVVREAIALLDAGVASAEDIDLAVRTSFGIRFPVTGPLESADLTGLDVIEAIHRYLLPDLDRSAEPQHALTERVAAGSLGVKSGRGFHDWTARDAGELVRRRDQELVRRLHLNTNPTAQPGGPAAGRRKEVDA